MKKYLCFMLLVASGFPVGLILAQNQDEIGRPFITTFTQKDYPGDVQTWAFIQDSRGVIYAGNQPGVLEYDGSSWRMIPTANYSFVRSLDIDENGRIYVGAQSDIGYLAPDSVGELKYVSLVKYIPEKDRDFNYVWTTKVTSGGIYFQSREKLFRFIPQDTSWQVKIWQPKAAFNFAFWFKGNYYVQQGGLGMSVMVDDSLQPLPGGEQFGNDRLQVMLPLDGKNSGKKDNFLVGTFNRGFFRFDGSGFKPFKTEADGFLEESTLYDATILPDGNFALVTISGGLVIMTPEGEVVQYLNHENGLASNALLSTFTDRTGALWIGAEGAIQIIETPSPLSWHNLSTGLDGGVLCITRNNGVLYCGTSTGIYYLDKTSSRFKPVAGLLPGNTQTFDLKKYDNYLLAGVGTGLYRIDGDKATILKPSVGLTFSPNVIEFSKRDPNRIFIGALDGLHVMHFDQVSRKWIYDGSLEGIHEYVQTVVVEKPNVVWLGSLQSAIRITFIEGSLQNPTIERFNSKQGLPAEGGVIARKIAGKPIFITNSGVFRYDEQDHRFYADTTFKEVSIGKTAVNYNGVTEDKQGNIWVNLGKESVVLMKQDDESFKTEKTAFQRFADIPSTFIYPEEDGIVWFGSNDGLIRYDPSIKKNYTVDFSTLVRRVTIGEDSVVYGGEAFNNNRKEFPTFDYKFNAMRFQFAAPTFDNPKEIQYQSRLEGFDERWSAWSKENKRDYTNLPFGEYKFHVQAKNIYQHLGTEATFEFSILPPWYRTWWAYLTYLVFIGVLVFAADRTQRRRLIKRERDRAQLREAELRAKEAEARSKASQAEAKVLQAENERKKNIELLSEIGKEITASLSLEGVIDIVYEHVNTLMDASAFGIGVYNKAKDRIDMPATKEKGETLPLYYYKLKDDDRPAVWCYKNQQEIFINDYEKEYTKYIKKLPSAAAGDNPESMMYLPVTYQNKRIGVITAQSFKKNAFTEFHLNVLRNLATYAAIALDNADAYRKLNSTVEQLNKTLDDLKATQQQLITQEKLASLGALTAGIAHEIKNPLNFVNNFADLSVELVEELREDLGKQKEKLGTSDFEELEEILSSLEQNARKINEHGKRADSIVHSMLQHSRGKTGERQETDINAMLEEDLNLAYHGMRARDSSFNVTMETDFDANVGKLSIIPQDVSRVFLNILTNSFYEVHRKRRETGDKFSPQVSVCSKKKTNLIEVRIRDNGDGIPESIRDKLFNPFFTTKPSGQGTGLGLSLSYDIIAKEHHGDITFESKDGEYTEFIITLPSNGK